MERTREIGLLHVVGLAKECGETPVIQEAVLLVAGQGVPNAIQAFLLFLPQDVLLGLKEKGHEVEYRSGSLAVVQSIENRCRLCGDDCLGEYCIHAVSDGRKGGVPDGY